MAFLKNLINHLYWSIASTPRGNKALMKAKSLSVDNRIHNMHQGHNSNFPKCLQGDFHGHEVNRNGLRDVSESQSNISSPVYNSLVYCSSVQIQKKVKRCQPLLQVRISVRM